MRLSLRTRLTMIVGTTALTLVILFATAAIVEMQVDRQLHTIEAAYLPKLELGPRLENSFEHIRRGLQDAVAAQDPDLLEETHALKDTFFQQLSAARKYMDPVEVEALRHAVEEYYTAAYNVSNRLNAGETGEVLVTSMDAMQRRHARALTALQKATEFDRKTLTKAFADANRAQVLAKRTRFLVSLICLIVMLTLAIWLSRSILDSVARLTNGLKEFGNGDFTKPIVLPSLDELAEVAGQANQMAASLLRLNEERDRAEWIRGGYAGLLHELRGELEPEEVADRAIRFLARYIGAPAGALYVVETEDTLKLLGHYALSSTNKKTPPALFRAREGLVGEALLHDEPTVIADPPEDYLRIRSGLGEGTPKSLVLLQLMQSNKLTGVLELALFKPWTEKNQQLFTSIRETLAITVEVARARSSTRRLLIETQRLAAQLSRQEEDLRSANEELQAQQEELSSTNEELRKQTDELERQRRVLQQRNGELDEAREHLERKAAELATVSTYKSQFLANMSHELRTPLNSMLLLSNLLTENAAGNLTAKQVEYSKTINSAGKDLLSLINQVLDLSKVEAGRQDLHVSAIMLRDLASHERRIFEPLAVDKDIGFSVEVAADLPDTISTDKERLTQILNNLLGNAIKFTEQGSVVLRIFWADPQTRLRRAGLRTGRAIAFAVSDTGPGIAPEHQERVFAPFEQVENSIDRRYGGTGLGLTITRELAALLGGEIDLQSEKGKGSTFTCYLPEQAPAVSHGRPQTENTLTPQNTSFVPAVALPKYGSPKKGEDYLLIVEDDRTFAEVVAEVIHHQELKYKIASTGEVALKLIDEQSPTGIILDVKLPDMSGWTVLEILRANPNTSGLPIHIISAMSDSGRGLGMGVIGYLTKPATRKDVARVVESLVPKVGRQACRILVVEDDNVMGDSLMQRLADERFEAHRVTTAREALGAVSSVSYHCIILDLSLPDMDGLDLLQSLYERQGAATPALVVYTARALSKAEAKRLEWYAEAVILKEGTSSERLMSEIRLFARRLNEGLPPKRRATSGTALVGINLQGRKILVVDDDMRTVYALSALLRAKGADVLVADTGRVALDALEANPDTDAVLIDVMMPEMDGYEAMRRIRKDPRFQDLVVFALTAKAMKGDREKCIEAGATDYLAKPIDPDRLLAMLRSTFSRDRTHDGSQNIG